MKPAPPVYQGSHALTTKTARIREMVLSIKAKMP